MKKKKTAVLLYPEFSEYELTVALSILMQGNKPIITVGIDSMPVKGESGLTCVPDTEIDDVDIQELDSLLLPGCMDISLLFDKDKWFAFIRKAVNEKMIIASISSSPYLLAKAGVLKGKKYTIGMEEEVMRELDVFEMEKYSRDLIVQDGNLITAKGSGFIEFGNLFGQALGLEFDMRWYGKR
ncbi:DJ-1/PfpI family protein [Bacillus sp. FJAT-49736]|uniref:DJ-1/PfpI family protein n=1 Tax=Bacillus sp. FJAT-49736 TaxID=2833582 RepID=UPI001BCA055A|nr:DJ-1/PfpI family protein [Bacillus sp. FJAT-49736]MBS4174428.1 DJ-1/PfpI family protein [Bacillus sp. FJAT-49736]